MSYQVDSERQGEALNDMKMMGTTTRGGGDAGDSIDLDVE
jgi:hypothetical protein